ncbi:MAG: carboxypeptidase regulatory-like domain-containing protein [Planctomycetes bacterium]|nr:carboxypeptidase regulatory-like domain-containing protein [Planctomycetota bacterium]
MKMAIFASISILLLCGAVSASNTEISWIHGENPPDFSRTPENPTTADLVHFTVPTDVFMNQWAAERILGGTPSLYIDPVKREIELWFQGPADESPIFLDPDPVSGLEGHFGPLEEGTWLLYVHFPGTIWFDSFEVSPPTPLISGRVRMSGGAGIGGANLTFSNGGGSTVSDSSGFYTMRVPEGWSGTATPSKGNYIFTPSQRSYLDVISDIPDQDYVGLTVPPPAKDYFTEYFSSGEDIFDLSNRSVMFTPTTDGSFYSGSQQEIKQLPTDPAGGKELSLGDDDYEFVKLDDQATVSIFAHLFQGFYVGSNGYITFFEGDNGHSESLSEHFNTGRISGLFEDLNPSGGGLVSRKQLADRAVVTWENVPEYGSSNSNTFQIEMFFDGRIQISWLTIEAVNGIVGLSTGLGVPEDFVETDISDKYPLLSPVLMNFTEHFSSEADTFDVSNRTIVFEPTTDGTSYSAFQKKITQLPTNPAGGTEIELGDDDYEFVKLNGQATVSIFGSVFASFYVGSNGYITFTEGDDDYSESLADHFGTRRISILFNDLNPSGDGLVSRKQLADRAVVTWENVHEYSGDGSNTFQVEMYFDGRIQISWLTIEAENGIVGLSDGLGVPEDFEELDFSKL